MATSDLAHEATRLLDLAGGSQPRALSQLSALAARQVPGCSAATAALWLDGEPTVITSSYPNLGALIALQHRVRRGPAVDALAAVQPVSCADTLSEQRWPEYAAAALVLGVRCSLTLAYRSGPNAITLGLYGARPRAIAADQLPVVETLGAFGSAIMQAVAEYRAAEQAALQAQDAAETRALVEQARGILMHALGCNADEALDRMRRLSQDSNIKTTEVARKIIDAQDRPGTRGRPGAKGKPGEQGRADADGRPVGRRRGSGSAGAAKRQRSPR
jgi:hypothetical protein